MRLVDKARTTKNIDVLVLAEEGVILSSLRNAGKIDLGDWFQFEIENNEVQPHQGFGGLRFPIRAFLDGRTFESFHIDVGVGDPVIESAEELVIPPLIAFAEFPPTRILCYPITQQIAEKVHAYTLLKILSMAHTTTITSIHRGHLLNGCFPDHLTG